MTNTIRLGRVLGIPVGVNWSIAGVAVLFVVSLALQVLPLYAPDTSLTVRLVAATIGVIAFFASILAHELGHAVVALGHGIGVQEITLWLLGGVAKLERQAPSARAELQVAVAGPAVSLVAGVFFGSLAVIANAAVDAPLAVAVLAWLGGVNLVLAVFNLAPAAPLDGGRVLTAVLWSRLGDPERARVAAGRSGIVLGVVLAVAGVAQVLALDQPGGWLTALVGAFMVVAARSEIITATLRGRLQRTAAATVAVAVEPVPDSITVDQLRAWLGAAADQVAVPVVRWDRTPIGFVTPDGVSAVADNGWTRLHEIMVPLDGVTWVSAEETVDDLVRRWGRDPDRSRPRVAAVGSAATAEVLGTVADAQIRPLLVAPDLWGRDRPGAPRGVPAAR